MDFGIAFLVVAIVGGLFLKEIRDVVASPPDIVHRGSTVPRTGTKRGEADGYDRGVGGADSVSSGQVERRELPSFLDRHGHVVDESFETDVSSRSKQETEATPTEVTPSHVTGSWTPEQSALVAGMTLMLIVIVMATLAFSISISKEEGDEEEEEEGEEEGE